VLSQLILPLTSLRSTLGREGEEATEEIMSVRNVVVALVVGVGMLFLVVELVRRRKLREEYSWLWLLTAAGIIVLTVWFSLLKWITHLIGAVVPSSTIFMFFFLFLVFISLHFSVVISKLTDRTKELAQRYALLEREMDELKQRSSASSP
jgi:hypothetical protein